MLAKLQPQVQRGRLAAADAGGEEPVDAPFGLEAGADARHVVGGAVLHDDDLQVGMGLLAERPHRAIEHPALVVAHHQKAHRHLGRGRGGLRLERRAPADGEGREGVTGQLEQEEEPEHPEKAVKVEAQEKFEAGRKHGSASAQQLDKRRQLAAVDDLRVDAGG